MAKTYWIGTYPAVTNPDKVAAYAIAAGGGNSSSAARPPRPTRPASTSAPW